MRNEKTNAVNGKGNTRNVKGIYDNDK